MRITGLDTLDVATDGRTLTVRPPPCASARACWASSVNSTGPLIGDDALATQVTSFVKQVGIASASSWTL